MGILFGQEKRAQQVFPVPPIPAFLGSGGSSSATSTRNADQALAVPTVWACVGLLSNAVSMLPLEMFRRPGATGVPARIADPELLTSPAAGMTQSEWLHMVMVSLLLRGNCYGLIVARDNMQRPTQVEILNPDRVRVDVNPDSGRTRYFLGGSQTDRAADIWHVKGLTMPGGKVGLSPVAYAAATLGIDLSSRSFAGSFFSDGAHPSSILSTDQPVNQEQAQTIKQRFNAAITGREVAVLGAGVKYTPIQVTPEESQFLATQQANVAQIARYFWVPPEMVGGSGGNSMTYANVEQRSLDFLTYGVSFWLKRIEDAMSPLFDPDDYPRFSTSALLRTDAETQAKVDVTLIAGKIKTPSEIRSDRDLPPMTDAQLAEAGLVPLEAGINGSPKPVTTPPAETDPAALPDLVGATRSSPTDPREHP